jgi:hypothetical protein
MARGSAHGRSCAPVALCLILRHHFWSFGAWAKLNPYRLYPLSQVNVRDGGSLSPHLLPSPWGPLGALIGFWEAAQKIVLTQLFCSITFRLLSYH